MHSIAKKEQRSTFSKQTINWTPHNQDILTHFLGKSLIDDFTKQWGRILDKVGFYEHPYSEQAVEQAKAKHFWHQVAQEISETLRVEQAGLRNLPDQFQVSQATLTELAEDDNFTIKVTVDLGKRLLKVHKLLRPEFYH